jgi:thiamine biosynthesis lipoprotein
VELGAFNRTQLHMGTFITLQNESNEAINVGFETFRKLDKKLSTYKKESEVSKYNSGKRETLSKETLNLIAKSREIEKLTNGYFDINFRGSNTLDFGGIAKGYAVDEVAKNWKNLGVISGTISASGDIRCLDICDGFIEDPIHDGNFILKFRAVKKNLSISTSGNSRRPNHLKNPKTKESMNNFNSLTLFGFSDNTTLDALTTAISVMPIEEAKKFLNNLKNFGWIIVDKNNKIIKSKNIKLFIFSLQ